MQRYGLAAVAILFFATGWFGSTEPSADTPVTGDVSAPSGVVLGSPEPGLMKLLLAAREKNARE